MFALTILGNNSAVPAYDRNPTAQVLQTLDESYLIDCGEGTQMQMSKYKIKRSKISRIFISHLHGDHYYGLIGLLTSVALLGRTHDMHIYAPKNLEQILNIQLQAGETTLPYKLIFHALTDEGIIMEDKRILVECFKTQHRIECWGFLFREKKKLRKIDADRATAYEIPTAFYDKLQQGHNYVTKKGTIVPNEEVTLDATPPKTYAFCADTIFDETLIDKIKNVDLLYHETTYLKDLEDKAKARYHCTTVQAANIATKANAKKLLIGHFSSKYESLEKFLEETSAVFKNTELALEGTCFAI